MYAAIDIGGTKTLVAALTNDGRIVDSTKFPTPKNYEHFLLELANTLHHFKHQEFLAAGVAVPGRLDRQHGRLISLGNLPWKNKPIQRDAEKLLNCPVVIENDANLAGLSESMLHKDASRVLYVTISTGIGTALMENRQLVHAMLDSEGGRIELPYKGTYMIWEKFASGKAIYEHFGKKAADITDEKDWRFIARNIALGLFENIAIMQPQLIVIGGSIGTYFDRYSKLLREELKKHETPLTPIPQIVAAQRPEEAVVYGCYDLAKQVYGSRS